MFYFIRKKILNIFLPPNKTKFPSYLISIYQKIPAQWFFNKFRNKTFSLLFLYLIYRKFLRNKRKIDHIPKKIDL
ncbi:MAG: hypothetical protein EAZ97_12270 [Bacteroidetes bacterium]|nr:MAG: hypothetical protein EAZ97_12270 [Bacteroidota bacterium]